MKQANAKFRLVLIAIGLVCLTGGSALADDTELFISNAGSASSTSTARPNIMFIIDTSGSMRSQVLTQADWDPNLTFSGCYRSDAVYWSYTAQQPSCWSSNWFYASRNYCKDSYNALNGLGAWSGKVLAWRQRWRSWQNRWVSLSTSHSRNVECMADAGLHGQTAGAYWATDGSGSAWASNANNEPAWTTSYHLFNGNYLNWLQGGGTVAKTRIDIVKEVTNNLLDNLNNVNVGLMRFNYEEGGPVLYAMEDIATARAGMKSTINNLPASGWTPLSETLYEAGQYFAGRNVDFGNVSPNKSVAASRTGGSASSNTYDSPIDFACQKNYIVLLTDGEPTRDTSAETKIENLPFFSSTVGGPACQLTPGSNSSSGKCLDEMADYLHNKDLSYTLVGNQNVTTYTIGFTVDLPLLKQTALRGGGDYYLADDTTTLSNALTKIVVSILDDASTFTAPSVPVNAFNRTQNLDDIFVGVFNPSSTVNWPGNLKKYKLAGGQFVDANQQLAVDPTTGFFKDTAQSFWSAQPDGDRPTAGGAAENLPVYADRNLYTDVAGGVLNSTANAVSKDNTLLTGNMLGGASETDAASYTDGLNMSERDRILEWMRGMDLFDDDDDGDTTDTRHLMGDPLHVRPVPVIYGGTAQNPDMVIYIATNEGYLHAVDPQTGEELWSYVPSRLLQLMQSHYLNEVSPNRTYGIDGEITAAIVNDDKIGGITGTEKVILTFGMRRGGDAYFAIDVTDRNNPKLLWTIDSNTAGFGDLGQTWSTPQHAKVRVGADVREVLFFGGGYDPVQDNPGYRTDNQGNAVYMVDLETGDLIWSAGNGSNHDLDLADMTNSIPAPLRVADLNADGLASRLYFGDMGGRLWRIDILNGKPANEIGQGGVLATLGAADLSGPTSADMRRFYNQADIVDVNTGHGTRFLAVNIGSGYRAHPLDSAIDENFFSIRDFNVLNVLDNTDYTNPVVFDELENVVTTAGINMDSSTRGWYVPLQAASGEKVLSRAITFEGTIFFTSFAPGSGASSCTAVAGQNRLYAISLLNGESKLPDDQPFIQLSQGGIAPQVELLYVPEDKNQDGIEEGKLIGIVGTEDVDLNSADPLSRTYWSQDGAQ